MLNTVRSSTISTGWVQSDTEKKMSYTIQLCYSIKSDAFFNMCLQVIKKYIDILVLTIEVGHLLVHPSNKDDVHDGVCGHSRTDSESHQVAIVQKAATETTYNISKMDMASIVKDVIDYTEHLQQQERAMMADISVIRLAAGVVGGLIFNDSHGLPKIAELLAGPRTTRKKMRENVDAAPFAAVNSCHHPYHQVKRPTTTCSPLHLVELKVIPAGEGIWLVSLTCMM